MYAPVQTDKTKESVQELLNEMRGAMGDRPISGDELREAQQRLTRTLAGRWETGNSVGRALEEIVTYDLPEDYYRTYAEKVRGVTADAVTTISRRLISPDRLVLVVVGDRKQIEPGIRELGLGEPRILDADGHPLRQMSQ